MDKRNIKSVMRAPEPYAALLVAMASVSVSTSLMAQDTATNDATDAYYTTNRPGWLNPNKPLTLSYGAFDIHPRLRVTEFFDNNILFANAHKEEDGITQVSPGVQILGGDRQTLDTYVRQYKDWNLDFTVDRLLPSSLVIVPSETWPDKFLVVDYNPQFQQFYHYRGNDSVDQFLKANAVWPMAKLAIGVQEDYSAQKATIIEAQTRSKIEQDRSALDVGYRLNDKFSLDSTFDRQEVSYPDTATLNGYTEWKGSVSVNRQINEPLNTSVVVAGGEDEVTHNQSQQFAQFGGRARYQYSQLISFDAAAGLEYRAFDTGRSSTFAPYFLVSGAYQPWERFYIRAGLIRQQYASLYNGTYYTSTGGYVTLHRDITDRFSVWSDLLLYRYSYGLDTVAGTVPKSSDYYAIRLTGDMKIWRYLDGQLYYQFSGSGVTQQNSVLTDNQVGVQFNLVF